MNIVVTGATGFIGSYLVNTLSQNNDSVYSVSRSDSKKLKDLRIKSKFFECDFGNSDSIEKMFSELQPDVVYHLAAQSNIPLSWKSPSTTFNVNINGTTSLLEAARNSKIDAKIHIVCSSSEYGSVDKNDIPIHEDVKFRPSSPYAVSKVTQDMLGYSYWKSYGMKITRSRPFAIIGPGKIGDALSDWAQNIVEIESNKKEHLMTGNLSSVRDFLDVRDCTFALIKIVEEGKAGEVYNVCSGIGIQLDKLIEILQRFSKKPFSHIQDPQRLRPSDDPVLIGKNEKLKQLGWTHKITIENTIKDILQFHRQV
ncbi:MAG: GDP-mannose 4,6-dehydratase [Thaumarchaeota archaeon]|nr:GDP-mannose 4,6-dehydratase [Nitrososphaerota archaeon]